MLVRLYQELHDHYINPLVVNITDLALSAHDCVTQFHIVSYADLVGCDDPGVYVMVAKFLAPGNDEFLKGCTQALINALPAKEYGSFAGPGITFLLMIAPDRSPTEDTTGNIDDIGFLTDGKV